MKAAHETRNFGKGVLLGALDTGVDIDHEEFRRSNRPNKKTLFGYIPLRSDSPVRIVRAFDTEGHGTHVAGIMVGNRYGIARQASFRMAAVIESELIKTSFVRVVREIDWLLKTFEEDDVAGKPAIVNMSLGFPPEPVDGVSENVYSQHMAALESAVRTMTQANVLVVAAVGNDKEGRYRVPAGMDDVLAVGAVNYDLEVASFSGSRMEGVLKPDVVGYETVRYFVPWRV